MRVTGIEFDRERGGRIKEAREGLGLTQEELAPRVGVSKFAISKWESGNPMQRAHLRALATEVKRSQSWILTGVEDQAGEPETPEDRIDAAEARASRIDARLSREVDELRERIAAQQELLEALAASSPTPLPEALRRQLEGAPHRGIDPAKG